MPATQMKQRITFRNILFATDFSSAANSAMPHAASLARSFDSKLFAMHVKEPIDYAVPPEMWASAEQACEMELQQLRDSMNRDFPELKPEVLESEGGLWPALVSAVEKYKIDLIVVGTRGRTGIGKALLGSQAEEILRYAPCPVLTIGPKAVFEEETRGKLTSVLCATNFGPASLAAANIAVSLAEENQCRLTLLHVIEKRSVNELFNAEEFGESSERHLRELVPEEANSWCAPHFLVEMGVPTDKILEVAHRIHAGMIVLGVHTPEGVPGAATHLPIATVHHIVAHAACQVLTVPG
ncbi:MAG TPA: universal stress protein [Candidatus Acidoferrum sp.]